MPKSITEQALLDISKSLKLHTEHSDIIAEKLSTISKSLEHQNEILNDIRKILLIAIDDDVESVILSYGMFDDVDQTNADGKTYANILRRVLPYKDESH